LQSLHHGTGLIQQLYGKTEILFVVIFTDQPGKGEVRTQQLSAHIEWLEANKDLIPIGGSLRKELGQMPKGGLWIAEPSPRINWRRF
jgi:hypothetical protein